MPWHNAPEFFFSAVRGCPRSCARTNPWFRSQTLLFLGTGGGTKILLATATQCCLFWCSHG